MCILFTSQYADDYEGHLCARIAYDEMFKAEPILADSMYLNAIRLLLDRRRMEYVLLLL